MRAGREPYSSRYRHFLPRFILKKEISYDDAIAAPPSLTGWRSILNYLLITSTELGSAINARSVEQLKKTMPTPSPFEFRVELA